MTLSDLETELKAFEASLSILSAKLTVLSYILIFCTAVVVVGLILEYTPDFREWITGRPRDRRKRWPTRAGALLVILGVAGEVGFTFWSFKVESEIKSTNSQIERVLKAEIQILGTSAIDASNKSSQAIVTAGNANEESEKARIKAGEALAGSAKAVEEARNARREQEAITAENIRLQQQINPRRLSESQKRDLIAKLAVVPPFTVRFNESSAPNDTSEVFDFTDDLKDVFARMKLLLPEPPTTGHVALLAPTRVRGVIIGVKSKTEFPAAAVVLCKALTAWGFKASLTTLADPLLAPITYPLPDANTMFIKVGPKQ